MRKHVLALSVALMIAGCGGDAPSLEGSWKAGTGAADTITTTLTFGGGAVTMLQTGKDTATGCTNTATFTGTYSSTATTITMTFTGGTNAAAGCTDASKNFSTAIDAGTAANASLTNVGYTISGTTLTISVPGTPLTFTKQ